MARRAVHSIVAVLVCLFLAPISASLNEKRVLDDGESLCNLGAYVSIGPAAVEGLGLASAAEMLRQKVAGGARRSESATVRGLERGLVGSGAHREVRTAVTVALETGSEPAQAALADTCELLLLENLAAGVYADPFELLRLQEKGAVKYAHVYGDVDLERPARKSFQSIVELRQRLVPANEDGLETLFPSTVALPVHARYPPTGSESHFGVNITLPHVLIHCKGDKVASSRNGNLKREHCIYAQLDDTLSKIPQRPLQWAVPSGYAAHAAWVGRLTTSAGLVGVAAVFMASKTSVLRPRTKAVRKL